MTVSTSSIELSPRTAVEPNAAAPPSDVRTWMTLPLAQSPTLRITAPPAGMVTSKNWPALGPDMDVTYQITSPPVPLTTSMKPSSSAELPDNVSPFPPLPGTTMDSHGCDRTTVGEDKSMNVRYAPIDNPYIKK